MEHYDLTKYFVVAVNYDRNLDLKMYRLVHDLVADSVLVNQVELLIPHCMVVHRNLNYPHPIHHYRLD